jgi:hypothetical protein
VAGCAVPVRVVAVAEVVRADAGAEDDAKGDDADDGRSDDDDSDEDRGRTGPFPPPLPLLSLPPGGPPFGSTACPHSGTAAKYRPLTLDGGSGSAL